MYVTYPLHINQPAQPGETAMSVARITEITSSSKKSFEDAVKQGVKRASETLQGITSAWVADQEAKVKDGEVVEYRVRLKITFILKSGKK